MIKEIWVIGVEPPCPRCDLTRQRIERLVRELDKTVAVKKLVYSDLLAREFASSIGTEIGTAKDVVQRTGIEIDWERLAAVKENPLNRPEDIDIIDGPARNWSPDFDAVLRPCQEKAASVGLMITPIVVVDGEVKHWGSVPDIERLRSWLV